MNIKFYAKRNNCDSIVDYPIIDAEVVRSDAQQPSYKAWLEGDAYPIEFGEWTIGGKTFNAKFRYSKYGKDVYGYIGTKPLND